MGTKIDTGGVVAIKGFNYQHAVSILILLLHYKKNDFYIIPEGLDDIQVIDGTSSYFLQIKGKKITASNLIVPVKKQKESMIEKLVGKKSKDALENKYKIVCTETNCTLDDNKIKSKLFYSPYEPDINYIYSFDEESVTKGKYFKDCDPGKKLELKAMVNQSKCYITPFKNESSSYQPYLMGTIGNLAISLSPSSQNNALLILKDYISARSEIVVSNEEEAKDKAIHTLDIRYLFTEAELQKELKELIDDSIDDYFDRNTGLKHKIKSISLKIMDNLETDAHYIKVKETLEDNECKLERFIYDTIKYIDYSIGLVEGILEQYERDIELNHETLARIIVYYCSEFQRRGNNDNK